MDYVPQWDFVLKPMDYAVVSVGLDSLQSGAIDFRAGFRSIFTVFRLFSGLFSGLFSDCFPTVLGEQCSDNRLLQFVTAAIHHSPLLHDSLL